MAVTIYSNVMVGVKGASDGGIEFITKIKVSTALAFSAHLRAGRVQNWCAGIFLFGSNTIALVSISGLCR